MRKLSLLTLVIFSAIVLSRGQTLAALEVNLVKNPGFELGTEDWKSAWEAGAFQIDEQVCHSGKRSLRVQVTAEPGNYFCLSTPIEFTAGKNYRFSAWVKMENLKGMIRVWISGPKGIVEALDLVELESGTQDWKEFSKTFKSKYTGKAQVRVDFRNATGTVWFDDIMLSESEAPINLAWNSSFEICTNPGVPDCWFKSEALRGRSWDQDNWHLDDRYAVEGKYSLWIGAPDAGMGAGLWTYGWTSEVEAGKTYTVSWYLRSDLPDLPVRLWPGEGDKPSKMVKANPQWERVSYTFTTGKTVARFSLRIDVMAEKGTLWVDAIQLEEGEVAHPYVRDGYVPVPH